MDYQKLFTVENLLKVLLAIAIGVMLYKVFFGKETYYNYQDDKSDYAYPMDYEEDIDLVDAVSAPGDEDDMDLVSADSEEDDVDQIEEIEDVVDAEDDMYEYADDENEAYDDSDHYISQGGGFSTQSMKKRLWMRSRTNWWKRYMRTMCQTRSKPRGRITISCMHLT